MFPRIEVLGDLVPYIKDNPQLRIKPCPITGHTVVCYMLQDEHTFASANEEYARECRGITFDPDGKISARTMHKFFNVGERADTQPEEIDWTQVVRVMEKRDGSMVTPVKISGWRDKISGIFKFKTKKSFETAEAALADEIVRNNDTYARWLSVIVFAGLTPTFEITSPRYPIVVRYEKDELTLLHIRENESGRYLTEDEIKELQPPMPLVQNWSHLYSFNGVVSWDLLKLFAETTHGIEGLVLQLASGEMFKIKTKWYNDLHHSVTFTRWRDIARTVCEDKADDLKAAFSLCGRDPNVIVQVETKIMEKIAAMTEVLERETADALAKYATPKDAALGLKGHELFGLIMRRFRGQEIDMMEQYVKHHLDNDWNLEVVA